jgi:serine/threonine protein kinase
MSDDQHGDITARPRATATGDEDATVIYPRTVLVTSPVIGADLPVPSTDLGNHLPIGTFLGEFEITGLIGEGGFGIVYLAKDHSLQRRVALKEYMPSALAARSGHAQVMVKSERHRETFDAGLQSFVNEARLLAQFDHASLVKVYRFWEANGTAYMIMPFYEGVTLKEWLQARRLNKAESPTEERLMALLGPLTEALQVIHDQQCFHRDIAPDNILLLKDSERPLLLDFGAARRVIGDMTQALTVILKPGYAPIEQYAEVPSMKQGPWTDVYALAAVVYFAIVGKTPPTSVGRLVRDSHQALSAMPDITARYSPRFVKAIDAALAVKPDERTQSVADLRRALGLVGRRASSAGVHDFGMPSQPSLMPSAAAKLVTPLHSDQAITEGLHEAPYEAEPAAQTVFADNTASSLAARRRLLWVGGGVAAFVAAGIGLSTLSSRPFLFDQVLPVQPSASASAVIAAASVPKVPEEVTAATAAAAASTAAETALTQSSPSQPSITSDWEPAREFQSVLAQQTPGFEVRAAPVKPRLRIAHDKLALSVTSAQDGFVYVLLFGTDGHLIRIHPAGASANRIRAQQTLVIPPQSANRQIDLTVTGPPGRDQLLVIVSQHPRRFNKAGMRLEGEFGAFPKAAFLQALQKHTGSSALLAGEVDCAKTSRDCSPDYGAAVFEVEEVR